VPSRLHLATVVIFLAIMTLAVILPAKVSGLKPIIPERNVALVSVEASVGDHAFRAMFRGALGRSFEIVPRAVVSCTPLKVMAALLTVGGHPAPVKGYCSPLNWAWAQFHADVRGSSSFIGPWAFTSPFAATASPDGALIVHLETRALWPEHRRGEDMPLYRELRFGPR
jgi:hypothetical protein